MKKIFSLFIVSFLLIFTNKATIAQSNCEDSNGRRYTENDLMCGTLGDANGISNWKWWDIESNDPKPWLARVESGICNTGNPFGKASATSAGDKLKSIIDSKDYLPENGWVLIRRNFGCDNPRLTVPSFILYNTNTGILRVFVFISDSGTYNGYTMSMKMVGGTDENSHLLANITDEIFSQDKFDAGDVDGDFSLYYIMNKGDDTGLKLNNSWIIGDFELGYDPYLRSDRYKNREIRVTVTLDETNDVNASITGASCEGDYTRCNEMIFAGGSDISSKPGIIDNLENAAKGIKQVVNGGQKASQFFADKARKNVINLEKEFKLSFGESFLEKQTTFKVFKETAGNAQKINNIFKNISAITDQLPVILSGVSTFLGALGVLESGPPPVSLSQYNLSLEGKITREKLVDYINFNVPNTNYANDNPFTTPYYNCFVGLGGLKNTPDVKIKEFRLQKHRIRPIEAGVGIMGGGFKTQTYKSYRINNDLVYTHPVDGPKLMGVKASFVVKMPKRFLTEHKTEIKSIFATFPFRFNLVQYEIEAGVLEIAEVIYNDPDNPNDDELILISPPVDIKDFKGYSINVPAEAEVDISLVALYENGVVTKNNYYYEGRDEIERINKPFNQFELPPFSNYTSMIKNYGEERYKIEVKDKILESGQKNSYVSIGSVTLKPSFHAKAGSTLSVKIEGNRVNSGNGQIVQIPESGNCYNATASSARLANNIETETIVEDNQLVVYPNPINSSNLFINFSIKNQAEFYVSITNIQGKLVYEESVQELVAGTHTKTIDISALNSGIYFMRITTDGIEEIRKVIIQ